MYVHLYIYIYIYISCICCICDSARLKTTSVEMIPVCQPCNVSDTELSNRGFQMKAINGTRHALLYRSVQPPPPEEPVFRQCACMPFHGQRCAFEARPFGALTCEHCYQVLSLEGNVHDFEVECHCTCWVCDPVSSSEEPPPRGRSRSRSRSRAPTPDHEENPQP